MRFLALTQSQIQSSIRVDTLIDIATRQGNVATRLGYRYHMRKLHDDMRKSEFRSGLTETAAPSGSISVLGSSRSP